MTTHDHQGSTLHVLHDSRFSWQWTSFRFPQGV